MFSFETLLRTIGPGKMSNTAYDTAWIARLSAQDAIISNRSLMWICEHQLPDGSWGALRPFYYHDRVISTLAAMLALTHRGRRSHDRVQIERGLQALEWITAGATKGLMADPNGSTCGFEMIVPTLVAEAEALGIIKQQGDRILGRLARKRAAKLQAIHGKVINRELTIAFSAEMAGPDGQNTLDIDHLQEENGSVAHSPSATAYFAMSLRPGDPAAMQYLRSVVNEDGGAADVAPFDVFEPAWTLWNLALTGPLEGELLRLCQPHLDFLEKAWRPNNGIGHAAGYTPRDGDDTGLVYDVLTRFGRQPDLSAVLHYEGEKYFRCFAFEADPSISTQIHILGALRQAGLDNKHPTVQKVTHFLQETQMAAGYWFDKWHASPYYPTTHAIIICAGYARELVRYAVSWLLSAQNPDGSWGFYHPTAEETAYALQALLIWERTEGKVPRAQIQKGLAWLQAHGEETACTPLWIGKGLYCPEKVVQSAILSAWMMAEKGGFA